MLASFERVDRAGLFFLITLVIGGILNVSVGLAPWYTIALVIMFLNGLDAGVFVNLNMALIQAHTPNAIMGRVMSMLILLGLGMIATQPALRRMSSAPDPVPEPAGAPAGG